MKGYFYAQFLSNPVGEQNQPGRTLIARSKDGSDWGEIQVLFPPYRLKDNSFSIMHQRMGFYVSSSKRLLSLGFYGTSPTPTDCPTASPGLGRVVREVFEDGSFGEIYFLRYNRHHGYDETNTSYPFYTQSKNVGFVEACNELLKNRLVTMQWWEEDRSDDGFYSTSGLQAPCTYHRKDGTATALWKWSQAALSKDEGASWSTPVKIDSLVTAGAKAWGQRAGKDQFALVYNPSSDNNHRWPLAVAWGDDGINFNNLSVVESEVFPRRYRGAYKDFGSQYVRGIEEGHGEKPDDSLWIIYSMNKEDMWVCQIPLPFCNQENSQLNENFQDFPLGNFVQGWNIHSGKWAGVRLVEDEASGRRCLELWDQDPCSYAKAVRLFKKTAKLGLEFDFKRMQAEGALELCIEDQNGIPACKIQIEGKGEASREWTSYRLDLDANKKTYNLYRENKLESSGTLLPETGTFLERLVLHTECPVPRPSRSTQIDTLGDIFLSGFQKSLVAFRIADIRSSELT
ncbi:hypothetical protein MASR2M78_24530 [Treponema sp.]